MASDTAYLSKEGAYTIFSFGDSRLKFAAPYSLERYENVVQWDDGYILEYLFKSNIFMLKSVRMKV